MNSPEPTEESNPFEGFSFAEILGFVYHSEGEEGLRELLAMFDSLTREFIEEAVSELETAGLSKPAALVRTFTAEVPSELDSGNPYEEGGLNWAEWRRFWLNRRRVRTGEVERSLRAHKPSRHRQTSHSRH